MLTANKQNTAISTILKFMVLLRNSMKIPKKCIAEEVLNLSNFIKMPVTNHNIWQVRFLGLKILISSHTTVLQVALVGCLCE